MCRDRYRLPGKRGLMWYYVPSISAPDTGASSLPCDSPDPPPIRTVAHVERDTHAAATLVARMEDQTLDQAPIWSDLTTFDGEPWRRRVDLITAGLPCQPFSAAGARAGLDDDRHLWPHARRIISEVGPRLVLLENVPDVVRAGWLACVLADLADLGFDAEWGVLSAQALGAPHRRRRFWLLAYTDRDGFGEIGWEPTHHRHPRNDPDRQGGENVDDTASLRGVPGHRSTTSRSDRRAIAQANADDMADRREGQERGEPQQPWPPRPDDQAGWKQWVADGGPEPSLRRVTDGPPPGLADAVHLGGNGLVPVVAAVAFRRLLDRVRDG